MPTAPLTLVFSNAAGEVFSHPAGYAVLHYLPGRWGVAEVAPLITRLGQLLLTNRWHHLLADARQMPALPEDVKAWLRTHWMEDTTLRPAALHLAVLSPPDVFARLSASEVRAQAPGSLQYQYFGDEAAAHAYLAGRLA